MSLNMLVNYIPPRMWEKPFLGYFLPFPVLLRNFKRQKSNKKRLFPHPLIEFSKPRNDQKAKILPFQDSDSHRSFLNARIYEQNPIHPLVRHLVSPYTEYESILS